MTFANTERAVTLLAGLMAVAVFSGCTAAPTPRPGVSLGGINVVCDSTPGYPNAPTCADAIAAAVPASGYAASAIDYAEYHFGNDCQPVNPCASAPPNIGYVLIRPKAGSPLFVGVSVDASGQVTVDGIRP